MIVAVPVIIAKRRLWSIVTVEADATAEADDETFPLQVNDPLVGDNINISNVSRVGHRVICY